MQVKVLALSTMALLFSGIARSEAPEDISVTYPQQYIVYDSDNSSSDPTLPEEITRFQYTIQVGTDPAVDNVYYHLTQYFQKSSPIDDPNYHVSGAATRGGGYYSGIQPHADGTVGFRFSSFIDGTTPKAPNCHSGADGGGGVTCALDGLPYTPNGKYTITIQKQEGDGARATFEGSVKDETTGVTAKIGAWSLPEDYNGKILSPFTGVVEIYAIAAGTTCADLPLSSVTYTNILFDDKPVKPVLDVRHRQPPFEGHTVNTCAGVQRSTSGKITYLDNGYTVSNSD